MYAQVEKSKENTSRAVANSVGQKKNNEEQGFVFEDNRPAAVTNKNDYLGNPRKKDLGVVTNGKEPSEIRGLIQRAQIEVEDDGLLGDDGRVDKVEEAVDKAHGMLGGSLQDIEEIETNNDKYEAFKTYFGREENDDELDVSIVRDVLTSARSELVSVIIRDHINSMDVEESPGMHAHSTKGGAIYLCLKFWFLDHITKAYTLAHEATHVAKDTTDDSGFGLDKALKLARENPAGAQNCAYNYEYFVMAGEEDKLSPEESDDEDYDEVEEESDDEDYDEAETVSVESEEPIISSDDELDQDFKREDMEWVKRLNNLSFRYNLTKSKPGKRRIAKQWQRLEGQLADRYFRDTTRGGLWWHTVEVGKMVEYP